MFRPRVIPLLLLKDNALVKSIKFKNFRYIGDPINAVKIFNDLRADELVFLDIMATKENRNLSIDFIKKIAEEANMPFAIGGGIKTLNQIKIILDAGAEKVIINSYAAKNPSFIKQASSEFGTSTISVCIDYKKNFFGKEKTWVNGGSNSTKYSPIDFAQLMEDKGAGEVIIQSIEKDGTMTGYDIDTIKRVSESITIPVVALGGAKNIEDLKKAYKIAHANGLAGGSIFIYQGSKKGVLINYPSKKEIIM